MAKVTASKPNFKMPSMKVPKTPQISGIKGYIQATKIPKA